MTASNITQCDACPRLRKHCLAIAHSKRRAFASETYWGKPIPGFGDPRAQMMIVGLAPAAHGANRTGRIFTGDRSGDWLYRALYKAGFANQPRAVAKNDGLQLSNCYITCVVRCAPPDNKPLPAELQKCLPYLQNELQAMPRLRVWVALGQIAYHSLWPLLAPKGGRKPKFAHGLAINLPDRRHLLLSYHPSQQNTFTGRLTEPMFDSIFELAKTQLKAT